LILRRCFSVTPPYPRAMVVSFYCDLVVFSSTSPFFVSPFRLVIPLGSKFDPDFRPRLTPFFYRPFHTRRLPQPIGTLPPPQHTRAGKKCRAASSRPLRKYCGDIFTLLSRDRNRLYGTFLVSFPPLSPRFRVLSTFRSVLVHRLSVFWLGSRYRFVPLCSPRSRSLPPVGFPALFSPQQTSITVIAR